MSQDDLYRHRWEAARRVSNWIKKNLDRESLGISDIDSLYSAIRYDGKHRFKGILRFGLEEFKSTSPIMSLTQYLAFNNLHFALRTNQHYAGFPLILYHAKFIDEADERSGFTIHQAPFTDTGDRDDHGNLIIQGTRIEKNVSLKTIQAVCSLRADIP